jgi:hypothetical protein
LFSFALSGLEIKEVMKLFPGAYAPGYALFRPFGPNKEKNPLILHQGLVKKRTPALQRGLVCWWKLLDGNTLCEVAGFIDVVAADDGGVIGQ